MSIQYGPFDYTGEGFYGTGEGLEYSMLPPTSAPSFGGSGFISEGGDWPTGAEGRSSTDVPDDYQKGMGSRRGEDVVTDPRGVPSFPGSPSSPGSSSQRGGSSGSSALERILGGILGYATNNPIQALALAGLAASMFKGNKEPIAGYRGKIDMGRTASRVPSSVPKLDLYSGKPVYGPTGGGVTYAAEGGLMGLARGQYLQGPTDGMADELDTSIDGIQPAKLSHGEFVVPADVVSHLGNGNSDAGADVLYEMMDRVREARTGTKKQGKQINPDKFMPGGKVEEAKYAGGGAVAFAEGDKVPFATSTASNLSEWAGPYVMDYLSKARALSDLPYQSFAEWSGGSPLSAGESPLQAQAFKGLSGLVTPEQFQAATDFMRQAGQRATGMGFTPQTVSAPSLTQYQMQAPGDVSAPRLAATPQMQAAQTGYQPGLQAFQMGPAERVSTQSFAQPGSAEAYMSPYMQSVVERQQQAAQREADIQAQAQKAQFAKAGAFGGGRYGVQQARMAEALARQKGDIQAQGLQSAYQQAQQQFNAEQQARLAAQQANQQAGLTVGGQNLAAQLGVQQLGTQTGLQTALANLNAQQQANVQNQAAQLQMQGLSAQQALQAALANQQAGMTAGQQNLAARLGVQQLGTQAGLEAQLANQRAQQQAQALGLQANQQLIGAGQGLAGIGQAQLGSQLSGLQALLGAGGIQQQTAQQGINALMSEYNRQMMYPYQQLQFQQSMMQGLPVATYSSAPNLSPIQQIGQVGGQLTNMYDWFTNPGGVGSYYGGIGDYRAQDTGITKTTGGIKP